MAVGASISAQLKGVKQGERMPIDEQKGTETRELASEGSRGGKRVGKGEGALALGTNPAIAPRCSLGLKGKGGEGGESR